MPISTRSLTMTVLNSSYSSRAGQPPADALCEFLRLTAASTLPASRRPWLRCLVANPSRSSRKPRLRRAIGHDSGGAVPGTSLIFAFAAVLTAGLLSGCESPTKLRWSRAASDAELVRTRAEVASSIPAPVVPAPEREYPIDLTTALRLAEVENPRIAEARQRIGEALALQLQARFVVAQPQCRHESARAHGKHPTLVGFDPQRQPKLPLFRRRGRSHRHQNGADSGREPLQPAHRSVLRAAGRARTRRNGAVRCIKHGKYHSPRSIWLAFRVARRRGRSAGASTGNPASGRGRATDAALTRRPAKGAKPTPSPR